jgi:cell division initiation protein
MITPIEIRQHSFKKAFQGYNKDEVQNFLNTLSSEWERMLEDHKRVKIELEKTQSALDNLRQVESALHKTLLQAEETSKSVVENAKTTAELRIQEADSKAKEMIKTAMEDRSRIEMQINELVSRRNEILQQLKSYLSAQTERLRTFEEKEMKTAVMPPMEIRSEMNGSAPVEMPAAETKVVEAEPVVEEAVTVVAETVEEERIESPQDNEQQSFFEKSVVSARSSVIIDDIADEL